LPIIGISYLAFNLGNIMKTFLGSAIAAVFSHKDFFHTGLHLGV